MTREEAEQYRRDMDVGEAALAAVFAWRGLPTNTESAYAQVGRMAREALERQAAGNLARPARGTVDDPDQGRLVVSMLRGVVVGLRRAAQSEVSNADGDETDAARALEIAARVIAEELRERGDV